MWPIHMSVGEESATPFCSQGYWIPHIFIHDWIATFHDSCYRQRHSHEGYLFCTDFAKLIVSFSGLNLR